MLKSFLMLTAMTIFICGMAQTAFAAEDGAGAGKAAAAAGGSVSSAKTQIAKPSGCGASSAEALDSEPAESAADLIYQPLDDFFTSAEIVEGDAIFNRINGKSYRENDDIALSDLRFLKMLIFTYDGRTEEGEMIVNAAIAEDVLAIFKELYLAEYPIAKMRLIDDYWTGGGGETDSASMRDNNTSAFCYRTKTNSAGLSNHALGYAIDINPLDNPYIYTRADGSHLIAPDNAPAPGDRLGEHAISRGDLIWELFTDRGFLWGGDWNNPKDYQHFEYIR